MAERPEPQLLAADNFTPLTRTPWAGTRLRAILKAECPVRPERAAQDRVGESWEVSVEPDFPAELAGSGELLIDWLERHSQAALGEEATRGRRSTALLVKLLDTAAHLSLQIHPADDYPGLSPGESGKPESWYVVHAEPDAGVYLGFAPGVSREDVVSALRGARPFRPLLRFVPAEPGDFFRIDSGIPHAIGPGLTLVEPQHVLPGSRGVTYRYWDWDRCYDSEGRLDPDGKPRQLHVDHALAVTRWAEVASDQFAAGIRLRAGRAQPTAAPRVDALCGPNNGLPSPWLQVWRVHGSGPVPAPFAPMLRSLTVLAGAIDIECPNAGSLRVAQGQSAVLPAELRECSLGLEAAHAIVACVA